MTTRKSSRLVTKGLKYRKVERTLEIRDESTDSKQTYSLQVNPKKIRKMPIKKLDDRKAMEK